MVSRSKEAKISELLSKKHVASAIYDIILLMAKRKQKRKVNPLDNFDGAYVLKLALYVILGSMWLKVTHSTHNLHIPIPLGAVIALFFTMHEHFRVDRKVDYAVIVVSALFGFMAPYGLFISI